MQLRVGRHHRAARDADDGRSARLLVAVAAALAIAAGSIIATMGLLKQPGSHARQRAAGGRGRSAGAAGGISANAVNEATAQPAADEGGGVGIDATETGGAGSSLVDRVAQVDRAEGRGKSPPPPPPGGASLDAARADAVVTTRGAVATHAVDGLQRSTGADAGRSTARGPFDPFRGRMSIMLPGPGAGRGRKPGDNMCVALEGGGGSGALRLRPCGTYDLAFDRAKGKGLDTVVLEWSAGTGRVTAAPAGGGTTSGIAIGGGADADGVVGLHCLTAADDGVTLAKCRSGRAADQRWDFRLAGAVHKRVGRLVLQGDGAKCLVQGRRDGRPAPVVGACDGSCSGLWTFDDNVAAGETPPLHGRADQHGGAGQRHQPTVLCWILTHPGAHATKAVAVNATWGKRCDRLLFMTTERHPGLETVVLDIGGAEDRGRLWNKSREAWTYTYKHHLEDYDWFVKADDDTYVVVDHLRSLLARHDAAHPPDEPKSFGRKFNATRGGYYAGGSGIVMNRAALRKLGRAADSDYVGTWGKNKFGPEDLLTGVAMTRAGVPIDNSADPVTGAHMFLPLGPQFERAARKVNPNFWFYRIGVAPKVGKGCCVPEWVAAHYVNPPHLYLLDDYEAVRCESDPDQWPFLSLAAPASALKT